MILGENEPDWRPTTHVQAFPDDRHSWHAMRHAFMSVYCKADAKMQVAGFMPGNRLFRKLALHVMVLTVFIMLNLIFYRLGWSKYNQEDMTWFDVVDYSVVTWMTVGYGNVYPTNAWAKMMSWAEMTAFLILTIM